MQNLKPMSLFVFVIAYVYKSKEQVDLTHIPTCDNFFDKDKVTRWGRVCAESIFSLEKHQDLNFKLSKIKNGQVSAFILDDIDRFDFSNLPVQIIPQPIDGDFPIAIISFDPIILSDLSIIDRNKFLEKLKDKHSTPEENLEELFVGFRNLGLLCGVPERHAQIYALKQVYNIVTNNSFKEIEFPGFNNMSFVQSELDKLQISMYEFVSMRPYQRSIRYIPLYLEYYNK